MSTLRNSVQRRNHKERSQPTIRQKWGLLEKHKDYILRAKDYHRKEKAIGILKSKAATKNPDEFYFGMIHSGTTKRGEHISQRNEKYDAELLELLKTQDQNYVNYKRSVNLKKLEKLKQDQHLLDSPTHQDTDNVKHILFVDQQKELENFDPVTHFDTVPELLDTPWNRLRKSALETLDLDINPEIIQDLQKEKQKAKIELQSRLKREEALKTATRELDMQKHLMGKGAKRKVGEDDKGLPIYKWKMRRSK